MTAYLTGDRVLRVRGREARRWLNSLLTADLRQEVSGTARYALLLTHLGGIVSDAWVVECPAEGSDTFALVLPHDRAERVYTLLYRYVLSEDVSLEFDETVCVVTVPGGRGGELKGLGGAAQSYWCNRLGVGGLDVWAASGEVDSGLARISERGGSRVIDAGAWTAWRIALGVPRAGVDFDEDSTPHEAGLDGRAVSFAKGCFLGQERVARQRRAGGLTRRLVQLEIQSSEPLPPGAMVRDAAGARAGRITSAAWIPVRRGVFALAYLTPDLAKPETEIICGEGRGHVRQVVGQADAPTVIPADAQKGLPCRTY
jgi:folate-binding protein YgfZ